LSEIAEKLSVILRFWTFFDRIDFGHFKTNLVNNRQITDKKQGILNPLCINFNRSYSSSGSRTSSISEQPEPVGRHDYDQRPPARTEPERPPERPSAYESKPAYQPEPTYEPEPVYQPEPEPEPEPTYQPEPTYEPEPVYQPEPEPTYPAEPEYQQEPAYHQADEPAPGSYQYDANAYEGLRVMSHTIESCGLVLD